MTRFVDARKVSEETGIPVRSLAQMAAQQRFGSMRPSKNLFMVDVAEVRKFLASRILTANQSDQA